MDHLRASLHKHSHPLPKQYKHVTGEAGKVEQKKNQQKPAKLDTCTDCLWFEANLKNRQTTCSAHCVLVRISVKG